MYLIAQVVTVTLWFVVRSRESGLTLQMSCLTFTRHTTPLARSLAPCDKRLERTSQMEMSPRSRRACRCSCCRDVIARQKLMTVLACNMTRDSLRKIVSCVAILNHTQEKWVRLILWKRGLEGRRLGGMTS